MEQHTLTSVIMQLQKVVWAPCCVYMENHVDMRTGKKKTKNLCWLASPILLVFQLSRTVHMATCFGNVIIMLSQIIQSSYLLTICKLFSYSDV